MANDYIINRTDPANGSFVIKPMTTNGPASPAAAVPLDSLAVSADTSLVLLGKGMAGYGERVAEDFVHLLENFAFATAPAYPIQGQLWYNNTIGSLSVFDGAIWRALSIGSLPAVGDLDMGGFSITNLANPVNATDAVNLQTADLLYVNVAGDTMTGALVVPTLTVSSGTLDMSTNRVINVGTPVAPSDAATMSYVDTRTLDDLDDVVITSPVINQVLSYDGTNWINSSTAATVSGLNDLSDVVISVPGIGDLISYDGVQWINTPISSIDRYVVSGNMSGSNLLLNFNTALPSSSITITGVAPSTHVHSTGTIYHDLNPTYNSSYLRSQFVPTADDPVSEFPQNVQFNNVVNALDQAVYATRSPIKRRILQSDGTVGPYDVPEYITYANTLSVFVNGVKQYASMRGSATYLLDGPEANHSTDTELSVVDHPIVAVTAGIPGTGHLDIAGDHTSLFTAGKRFSVHGSTGNNGIFEVASVIYSAPNTQIYLVAGAVAGIVDGLISVCGVADYTFNLRVNVDSSIASTPYVVVPPPPAISLQISSVVAGLGGTFTVSGEYDSVFTTGRQFAVNYSLGNDGVWTVASSTIVAGSTVVTVTGTIPTADPTGTISVAYISVAALVSEMQTVLDDATVPASVYFRDSAINITPHLQGHLSAVQILPGSSGTDLLAELLTVFAASEVVYDGYGSDVDVVAVDTVADTFGVTGDYTAAFPAGALFVVTGSTANNGVWKVEVGGSSYALGVTTIPVTGDVTSAVADGIIYFARSMSYTENGDPLSTSVPGDAITFVDAVTAGALIEISIVPR